MKNNKIVYKMEIINKILKKNKTSKKFNNTQCHPKQITYKKKSFNSCFKENTLNDIKNIWNKRYPDNKIISCHPKLIWQSLKSKLINTCTNEMCWIDNIIKNKSKKNKLKQQLFAPVTPKSWKTNNNEWLSSVEIMDVMKQYEDTYNNFKFFGPSPIDYDTIEYNNSCVWPELCNINIKNLLEKDKKKVGFIFNTDKHYQDGSHWIAMFLDLDKNIIFFFDSNGTKEPREITKLKKKIQKQCIEKCKIKIKLDSNYPFEHQKKDGECGMYCLYFIISLIKKSHNFNYFKTKKIPDKKMNKFRNIYFNNI